MHLVSNFYDLPLKSCFFGQLEPIKRQLRIFLTSKVSFTDQKLGYRVIVITVICSRTYVCVRACTSGAFVNVHIATSLKTYTCMKSIKFPRDAMVNDDICLVQQL